MPKLNDLCGKKFGRITVTARDSTDASGHAMWRCTCDCGNEMVVRGTSLKLGKSNSCGCFQIQQSQIHGGWQTPEHYSWANMISRCTNPNNKRFKNYALRGIVICDRWRYGVIGKTAFECFLEDMGKRPGPKYSIERVNNDGNYEPSNCIWATAKQQANNRRNNRHK